MLVLGGLLHSLVFTLGGVLWAVEAPGWLAHAWSLASHCLPEGCWYALLASGCLALLHWYTGWADIWLGLKGSWLFRQVMCCRISLAVGPWGLSKV